MKKEFLPAKEVEPKTFDVVVALGKNWRLPIMKEEQIHLSLESKMTTLAAAYLYLSGRVKNILFSTGHTAGKNMNDQLFPTESNQMYAFLRRYFPESAIPDTAIFLEEHSFDTAGNAEEVNKIVAEQRFKSICVLTVGFHLARSEQVFKNYGVSVSKFFSSQKILQEKDPRYIPFIRKYFWSKRHFREIARESIGFLLVKTFDRRGMFLRKITTQTRNRVEK